MSVLLPKITTNSGNINEFCLRIFNHELLLAEHFCRPISVLDI